MSESKKHINIALVGNPNSGKSSVFNWLTGLNQKVGNFPGITIDKKSGKVKHDDLDVTLTDLPGTYSLYPKSLDEIIVNELLLDEDDESHPDAIIVVLDASNLKRNLYILTQINDLHIPFVISINMHDLAIKEGMEINFEFFKEEFNTSVFLTNGKSGEGIKELIPESIKAIQNFRVKTGSTIGVDLSDPMVLEGLKEFPDYSPYKVSFMIHHFKDLNFLTSEEIAKLESINKKYRPVNSKDHLDEIGKRYNYVHSVIDRIYRSRNSDIATTKSDRADKILTHKFWGWLIFLFIFFLLFQAVFTIAAYPTDWIDSGMGALITWTKSVLPEGLFSDFITSGILTGINGIVVFIPQIMILFGLITILEDTGYMARVSFINDKLLAKVGMNGKSVVPIVGGFACAVPSIMAARSIQNKRQRLITIFITPLMSCSARLPVYVFLIAFLVKDEYAFGLISIQGLYMVGLYLLGVVFSILISALLNIFLKRDDRGVFTLEMPSFRIPRWKNVLMSMINSGKTFVNEAGKVILIVSMILWVLTSFGPGEQMAEVDQKFNEAMIMVNNDPTKLMDIELSRSSEKLEKSYAGIIGKAMEPAVSPLGFDWRTGIAILTSFAAREVFVGTMANIYHVDSESDNTIEQLQERLMNQNDPKTGKPYLSFATAWSLIIFYVFALQCASTVAVVRKETGGWKWPIVQFVAFTGLAWISSFITYSILS